MESCNQFFRYSCERRTAIQRFSKGFGTESGTNRPPEAETAGWEGEDCNSSEVFEMIIIMRLGGSREDLQAVGLSIVDEVKDMPIK